MPVTTKEEINRKKPGKILKMFGNPSTHFWATIAPLRKALPFLTNPWPKEEIKMKNRKYFELKGNKSKAPKVRGAQDAGPGVSWFKH